MAFDGVPNRLAAEKSPYLLQHAHNPVRWYPWGDEALERARREERPIFLSIGYSTCHWCHVMERESFENEDIAALMNQHFVCIKVDREERPDLDEIYMAAVQAMTGQGGWPLSAWLTPDLEPFYGGTYFPPDDRFGRPGFPRVLEALAEAWRDKRDDVVAQGRKLVEAISALDVSSEGGEVDGRAVVDATYQSLKRSFDPRHGGWGNAPKFPRADFGALCLRVHHETGDARALEMVTTTIDGMASGGLFDQLGGGFARYSTDDRWLVPHFEKMLYDNAQLAFHCLEAHQATGREDLAALARDTFEYVLRDMTHADGGFFSAEDADSEGEEGRFYVWSLDQIRAVLDDEQEFALFTERHGVTASGNWEGHNVLERATTIEHLASKHALDPAVVRERLDAARRRLLEARASRIRPGRDDKILTAWNGLMIQAFARGAIVLDDPSYADAAIAAATFVLDRLVREDGTLLRRWRDGDAAIEAFAEDYAFLVRGLLELAQTDLDPRWLETACDLHDQSIEIFGDPATGTLYNTRAGRDDLIVRSKAGYDGSTPTANSVTAANALVLHALTGDDAYREQAERIVRAFARVLHDAPMAMVGLVDVAAALQGMPTTVVVASATREDARPWVRAARDGYHPDLMVTHAPVAEDATPAQANLAVLEGRFADPGAAPRAYVCTGLQCRAPSDSPEAVAAAIHPEGRDGARRLH